MVEFLTKKQMKTIKKILSSPNCYVRRADEILENSFQSYSHKGRLGSTLNIFSVSFYSKDGSYLGSPKIGELFWDKPDIPGESISEAINRLGINNSVQYIVVRNYGETDMNKSLPRKWDRLKIYKM